nr:MAG TPA: hypothetical protein [Caudoviricetes sp.]
MESAKLIKEAASMLLYLLHSPQSFRLPHRNCIAACALPLRFGGLS